MKHLFSLLSVVICISFSVGSDAEEIRDSFNKYWDLTLNMDLEGLMNYMYPKVFELAPKEKMVEAMEQMFSDPTIQVGYGESEILSISESIEVDEVRYAEIAYSFEMYLEYFGEANTIPDKAMYDAMNEGLKGQYGAENVHFSEEEKLFVIQVTSTMFAIKAPAYDSWKFLEKKEGYQEQIKTWFPKKVIKKFR